MDISFIEIWLLVGIIFIIIEFSAIPGIGFLFIGMGALTTSILLYFYPDLLAYQVATVGISAFIWLLVLWWPLKMSLYKQKPGSNFDLIGSEVTVLDAHIKPGNIGQVSWSGTTMNAKLEDSEKTANIGDILQVLDVQGNVLICKRK